jgi:hypothetical protein
MMPKLKYTIVLLSTFLMAGCSGMAQDIFVGNIPNDLYDIWNKINVSVAEQERDLYLCKLVFERKGGEIPSDAVLDEYFKDRDEAERCMLRLGYKYYPRGLEGKKASLCSISPFETRNTPACNSVRWWD